MTITKEVLKAEIDKVQENYLDALYRIIKVFEYPPTTGPFADYEDLPFTRRLSHSDWLTFVNETYGCLADDPIVRGEQGSYEVREALL